MKKVFLSLPMSGRTQENIEFTIKAMTKKAKEILGEDIEVSHLGDLKKYDNMDILANPGMFNMVHVTSKMVYCDYFMGFSRHALNILGVVTHSKHQGCTMEEALWTYSQRYTEGDPITRVNKYYITNKKLPMVDGYNISEFIPELDTKEKVQAAKIILHSSYGKILKANMLLYKDLAIPQAAKDNKLLIIPRCNSKSLYVKYLNELDKEANNGKEENN